VYCDVQVARDERARGEGRIFLRGNVVWIQYYDVRGQQVRESSYSTDEKKAAKLLRRRIGEVGAGIHRDTRRVTYESLREKFYADYEINARNSLRRDKSGKPYLDKVGRLDDYFSGYRASDIDADLIRRFTKDQQGRGLANASINRSISALRRMFNLALEDGTLREIPHFPMLKEATPRQGFFEREQYESLSEALSDYLRLPLALGYYTGMRLGEVLSLDWNQVDFIAGNINLRAGETKNDDARAIPIVPALRVPLKEQFAKRQLECPYVCFRIDRNGRSVKIESFRKSWYRACVKAGLGEMVPAVDSTGQPVYAPLRGPRSKAKQVMTYKGMIFHDLRRTAVRNLVAAGVPEKVAQTITGHRTRSTFDRYHIVSQKDVSEAGRKLAIFHDAKVRGQFGDNLRGTSEESTLTN
jgi:integrase